MERSLSFTQRGHFLLDPVFSQCWRVMEEERLLHPGENIEATIILAGKDANPIVEPPWSWNNLGRMLEGIRNVTPQNEKSTEAETCCYEILLDVQHFHPSELSVVVTERTVEVKGKHDERYDPDGAVSREFRRRYILPEVSLVDTIECNLSSDGVLHISAPQTDLSDKCRRPRRLSLKDSIKTTLSSFISFINPNLTEGKVIHPPPAGGETSATVDETIHGRIHGLSDFDRIPFWSRQYPHSNQFGIKSDGDIFKALIDVRQYTPEELTVSNTSHHILVEGTHEDLPDEHGLIRHYVHFTRKYFMPTGVKSVRSRWTWDGALKVVAHKNNFHANEKQNEKVTLVPILVGDIPASEHTKRTVEEESKVEHPVMREKKTTEIPVVNVKKIKLPFMKANNIKHAVTEDKKTEIPVVDVERIDLIMENKKTGHTVLEKTESNFPTMEIRKIDHSVISEDKKDNDLPLAEEVIPVLSDKDVQTLEEGTTDMKTDKKEHEEMNSTVELPTDEQLPLSDDLKEVMGAEFVKQLTYSEIVNPPMKYLEEVEQPPAYKDIKQNMGDEHPELPLPKHTIANKDVVSGEWPPLAPGF